MARLLIAIRTERLILYWQLKLGAHVISKRGPASHLLAIYGLLRGLEACNKQANTRHTLKVANKNTRTGYIQPHGKRLNNGEPRIVLVSRGLFETPRRHSAAAEQRLLGVQYGQSKIIITTPVGYSVQ